jgi:hypothetical protein
MSSEEKFYVALLRRICYGAAFLIYHTLSLSDQAYAAHLAFKPPQVSEPASSNHFVHPPVRSKSYWSTTRLMCLEPGTGVEPLYGVLLANTTIKILSWSWPFGERRYDAISYCWGNSTATKTIYLDGKPLPITETLHVALQNLRLPHASRVLWADQICIDQSETAIDERNHQVQRMGEIYEDAETVIVWLGQATKASNIILDALSQVNDQTAELSDTYRHTELLPGHAIFESIHDELLRSAGRYVRAVDGHLVQETLVSGINNFLENPWFSRIWVLQEAVLAGNLFLQADRQQVSWKRFVGCVRSLQHITGTKPRQVIPVYDIEMLRNSRSAAECRNKDLLKLLTVFRGRQASDPRDKIFGLLGLVTHSRSEIAFRADYLKSFEQVFIDFTLWHIQVKGNLDVLANCCAEEEKHRVTAGGLRERRLPSWATDWSLNTAGERSDLVYDLTTRIQVYTLQEPPCRRG